jgi:large subunit ribosomal protein L22
MSETSKSKGASPETVRQPAPGVGYRAIGRFFRSPPDKVRIMGRVVLGLRVARALDLLRLSPNKSARLLAKLIHSAAANADRDKVDVDQLFVERVLVDRASMLKRYHPCAHGRAKPILKRSCHIVVQLERRPA